MNLKGWCLIVNIFGLDSASVGRFYACCTCCIRIMIENGNVGVCEGMWN